MSARGCYRAVLIHRKILRTARLQKYPTQARSRLGWITGFARVGPSGETGVECTVAEIKKKISLQRVSLDGKKRGTVMTRTFAALFIISAGLFTGGLRAALAQSTPAKGTVIVPYSSRQRPEDLGVRAHTNFVILVRSAGDFPGSNGPSGETPASLACVYELTQQVPGCPISGTTEVPTGGARAIAIVSAYDNPDAKTDLDVFSKQFGLPPAEFRQIYANGQQPPNDPGGWSLEEALAIEWAHAMAPKAKIGLVEAASDSLGDLLTAEGLAGELLAKEGGGEVSNSWATVEFSGEVSDDKYFQSEGVVYFASVGGGAGGPSYPGSSPYVVSAGATTVNRNSSGDFTGESGCCYGGDSLVELRPAYQNIIENIVGNYRGTPDLSFDGSPESGVSAYDADGGYGWVVLSGSAVSAPALTGIINAAGHFYASTNTELTRIYKEYGIPKAYHAWFRDITSGGGCVVGWDFCSGVGSVLTYKGK